MLSPASLKVGYSSDIVLVTKGVVSIMEKSRAELSCEDGIVESEKVLKFLLSQIVISV